MTEKSELLKKIEAAKNELAALQIELKEIEKIEKEEEFRQFCEAENKKCRESMELSWFDDDDCELNFLDKIINTIPAYLMPNYKAYIVLCCFYRQQKRFCKQHPSVNFHK